MQSEKKGFGLAVAGIVACVTLAHFRVVLGSTFVERDALAFTLPSREALITALRAGRVPEWFDGVGFGLAFAASPVHLVTSPAGWLAAVMGPGRGIDFHTLLLICVAGIGAAAFARSLGAGAAGSFLAGTTLAVGGYVTGVIPNGFAQFVAWTPWVGWGAVRLCRAVRSPRSDRPHVMRCSAALAASMAMQVAAGEPASIIVALMLAAAVAVALLPRRRGAFLVLLSSLAAALPLAAVSLLPAYHLLRESARAAGLSGDATKWSMHPGRVVELVWPMVFGAEGKDGWYAGLLLNRMPGDPCWSLGLYVGLPVLLLALGAAAADRTARRLLPASLVFVVMAMGSHLPVDLHPEGLVNFAEKYVFGAILLWSVLAGLGLTFALERRHGRWLTVSAAAGAALLTGGAAMAVVFRTRAVEQLAARAAAWVVPIDVPAGVDSAILGGCVAAAGAIAFALALVGSLRPRMMAVLMLPAILFPHVVAGWSSQMLAPRQTVTDPPTLLASIPPPRAASPRPRILALPAPPPAAPHRSGAAMARAIHESLESNVASRFGYAVLPGFDSAETARSRRFWLLSGQGMEAEDLAILLGADLVLTRYPGLLPRFRPLASEPGGWSLLAAEGQRARAFVAPRWAVVRSEEEALATLGAAGRSGDPGAVAVAQAGDLPLIEAANEPPGHCGVVSRRPEIVTLDCDSRFGGYAVLLDEAAAGWSGTVDGKSVPVLAADGLFKSVRVGPGRRIVEFRYRTPGMRAGAAISAVSWLALVCVIALLPAGVEPESGSRPGTVE